MYLTDYGVATVARPGQVCHMEKAHPTGPHTTGYGQHLENFSTPNMFIVFLEVQVDRETGKVEVLNMLGGTDCGQVIDPSGLEMQAQGGIGSASLDTATFEEHVIDPGTGRNMTYDMIEYKWRPFNEFPRVRDVHTREPVRHLPVQGHRRGRDSRCCCRERHHAGHLQRTGRSGVHLSGYTRRNTQGARQDLREETAR